MATVAASSLLAQNAQLTGRVTDTTQSVIPGASVSLDNERTGLQRSTITNAEGYYTLPSLPPGDYRLTVQAKGFRTANAAFGVTVGQTARYDVQLEVGDVAESIEVRGQAAVLDSESSALGQVIGGNQVLNLPLLGRNPYALAGLVPGVRTPAGMNDLPVDVISTAFASVSGGRGNANEYLLDGAPNTSGGHNQPIFFPSVDMVQEYKVETNSFAAEFGRAAGGVFNVVTRAGTNDVHFSAYEFLRNDKLNANNWFANRAGQARAPFRFNQFGGTFGGPLSVPRVYNGRDRTFLFASIELARFAQGVTFAGTVPTVTELGGDFSARRTAVGQPILIYDPLTTSAAGAGFVRQAFPGNRVPASRINPVAAAASRYWPAPNSAGAPVTGVNNFVRNDSNVINKDTFSLRADHNFSGASRLFSRFSFDNTPWIRAQAYGPDSISSPVSGPQQFNRRNVVVDYTHTFSPTLVGTFRASYARLFNNRRPVSDGFDITQLGLPAALRDQIGERAFPGFFITGYSVSASVPNTVNTNNALGLTSIIRFGLDTHGWSGQMTKVHTRHTLKYGLDVRMIRTNMLQYGDNWVRFDFGNAWTQGPNPVQASATAGIALASYLLGIGSGSVSFAAPLAHQNFYYGAYLQDDWKVTPRLTLNLGLRYEFESPRTDRFNQLTNFDSAAVPPLRTPGVDLRGALAFPGTSGRPRTQSDPDRNNFAPRIGFAYRVLPGMVIRAGGGLFYAPWTGIGSSTGNSGFFASTSLAESLDGVNPVRFLNNPYPDGVILPSGSALAAGTLLGQDIDFFDRSNRVSYSGQWNLNIQRQLANSTVLEIGYAGSRGLKLAQSLVLNQLPASALALGNSLRDQVPNPFFGQIGVGQLAQRTLARAQMLRPYPQFQSVTSTAANWASSTYHALEARFERRFAAGVTLIGSYTFSKTMDQGVAGQWAGEGLGGGTTQDWTNLRNEWSVSTFDQSHRLTVNSVFQLPFANAARRPLKLVLGGWELGIIGSLFSGAPIGIGSAVNGTFSQGGGQRPNWTGVSASLANPLPDRWFDTTQFPTPAAFRFGNLARTLGGLRAHGTAQMDVSLHKNLAAGDKFTLQLRGEFFNLTNTVRFAPPNPTSGNPQFGIVSAQGNQPRVVQVALKIFR
jgi:hypothetical protein